MFATPRRDGQEDSNSFNAWLRRQPGLPSKQNGIGGTCIAITDIDFIVHRYMTDVSDTLGSRMVQDIMDIEIKTFSKEPPFSQLDTMWKRNLFAGDSRGRVARRRLDDGTLVTWWGMYILVMSGMNPDPPSQQNVYGSDIMWWGSLMSARRPNVKDIKWSNIDVDHLIGILRFDLHPGNLASNPYRRHHKTRVVEIEEQTDLGMTTKRRLTIRS